MAKHNEVGKMGEDIAVRFLTGKGYTMLERNWRHKKAEVDMICMDGDVLVFVEVKTRSSMLYSAPTDAVTEHKMRMLVDAASVYMDQIGHDWEIRFDVVSILLLNEANYEVDHHRDAFFPGWE